jgi:hypothetical protein
MQRPSQPDPSNDGCLTLIDRFLDFTLVGIPRWNAEWLSRRSPAYQRRVNAYWERQRRNLYLPLILRSCTGVFAVLVTLPAAAVLAIKQVARRSCGRGMPSAAPRLAQAAMSRSPPATRFRAATPLLE